MESKPRFLNLVLIFVFVFGMLGMVPKQAAFARTTVVFINEVDADTPGTDVGEFVELYDGGVGNTALDGLVLVFYNGNGDTSYAAYDLDGYTTDTNGYFLLGNSGVVPEPSIIFASNGLQNGQDAVALYQDDAANFPNETPVTTSNLIDAIVYDTSDADDPGLLVLLNEGQPQVNESGGGNSTEDSNQRCPNGSGGLRNTETYTQAAPTPGTENCFIPVTPPVINEFSASTTGDDVEYVEVFGDPETDYSNYTVIEIEGDSDSSIGVIDEVINIGTTDTNGLYLADLPMDSLENGTISLLLVKDFTGAVDDDLDSDNDGVLDNEPWSELIDSVAVNDGDAGDQTYGTTELFGNYDGVSSFAPGGASRIPDGYDTDAFTDWVRNDFDLAGIPGHEGTIEVGEAYNTPGELNEAYTPPPEACGDPYTYIYDIQGSGLTAALSGTVSTEGVVVGDFQEGGKDGFYIQDKDGGDGDASTSDGIFIYAPSGMDVSEGDHVRIAGSISEYYNLTQISASQIWLCESGVTLPDPAVFALPAADELDFEKYEGMLVTIPQDLVISEYFNFDRYGEIMLTTERFMTYTALYEPDVTGFAVSEEAYFLNSITLDDGRTNQNPDPAIHPNGLEFTMDNLFRGGDLVTNVTGILDYAFSLYRIQPTQGADYTAVNTRSATPDIVEGDVKVASFNVLNYFTTLDDGTNDICGPSGDMECRGADDAVELQRQRTKILAAMSQIDADIFGLIEIENDRLGAATPDYAVADLVDGLNAIAGAGTYDYIATGAIGTDAIKQALIYKPDKVSPVGSFQTLTSEVDPRFIDTKNRPALAQIFQDAVTGEDFIVAVNHLKSKGSDCIDLGDPDLDDGAGNCNLTRLAAAEAMVDWLADETYFPDVDDVLIIGDLNSYDKEDPIDAIKMGSDDINDTSDDYVDLIYQVLGEEAYGYVFDGRIGYLDYALTNKKMSDAVVDVTLWHINADEPDLIDYDMSFKEDAQDLLYAPDPYRSSDHDPVIVTLRFPTTPIAHDDDYETEMDVQLVVSAENGLLANDYDPNGDALTAELVDGVDPVAEGTLVLNEDGSFTFTPATGFLGDVTFTYRVYDGEFYSEPATVTISVYELLEIFLPIILR